jgi:hypothetical protein
MQSLPISHLFIESNPPYEAVRQLFSPPSAGGDKGEGETHKLRNIHHLFHPHLYPPLEGMPSPIKGEGFLGLSDRLKEGISNAG